MTRLTLRIDERVAAEAKRLAEQEGTSVSAMFTAFVNAMAQRAGAPVRPGRLARQALGLMQWPKGVSERDLVADALLEKYGLLK